MSPPPSIFLIICNKLDVKKPKGPLVHHSALWDCFKILDFLLKLGFFYKFLPKTFFNTIRIFGVISEVSCVLRKRRTSRKKPSTSVRCPFGFFGYYGGEHITLCSPCYFLVLIGAPTYAVPGLMIFSLEIGQLKMTNKQN